MLVERKIRSLADCEKLAEFLVCLLEPNIFLLLQGELGVGKTTLTQLIAKKLGIKEKLTSPTFTICQRYQIKNNYYLNHFDFFRLNNIDKLDVFQELTIDNLNIIEWPEKNLQFWKNKKYIQLKLTKQVSEIRSITLNINFSLNNFQKEKFSDFLP